MTSALTALSPSDLLILTELKRQAKNMPEGRPVNQVVQGWTVRLSRMPFPDSTVRWALSARLDPVGRSSSDSDWNRLGRIVAALGAPEKMAIPIEETDPNGWHEWRWVE